MIQMVGPTRGTPEGFSHGQASGSQQPPPPPPNLAEVMALQTELLHQLVQGQQNCKLYSIIKENYMPYSHICTTNIAP